jgi:hypothetical protein
VERELPGNFAVNVGYIGNHGTHLFGEAFRQNYYVHTQDRLRYRTALDAQIPITDVYSGQTAARLQDVFGGSTLSQGQLISTFPFYPGGVSSKMYDGQSIYHGLNLRVQKRYSHGLDFVAAYTWSKKITNASVSNLASFLVNPVGYARNGGLGGRAGVVGIGSAGTYQDPDRRNERVIAYDDIPHMFNLAYNYELPLGQGKPFVNQKGVLNAIFGGWRLSGNFNASAGVPLSVSCPGNDLTTRCNLVGNPKFGGGRSKDERIQQWMNPAAFEPPFGSDPAYWANPDPSDDRNWLFGTAGARLSSLRSPGFWNLDAALGKRFAIRESAGLEFRWEVFNAFNHQNLGVPVTEWCLPPGPNGETDRVRQAGCSFGRISNIATDPRAMQFGLKFYW